MHAHQSHLRQTNSRRTSDGGIIVAERIGSVARRLQALAVALLMAVGIETVSPVLARSVGGLLSSAVLVLIGAVLTGALLLVWFPKRSTLRVSGQSVGVRTGLGRRLVVPLPMVRSATLTPMPPRHRSSKRSRDGLDTTSIYGGAEGDAIRVDYVAQDASARSFVYVTGAARKVAAALRHVGVRVEGSNLDKPRANTDADVC